MQDKDTDKKPVFFADSVYPKISDESLANNREYYLNRAIETLNSIKLKVKMSVIDRKSIAEKCNVAIANINKLIGTEPPV